MKIRSKHSPKTIVDGVIDMGDDYYKEAIGALPGAWQIYLKSSWEPVPTETWRDVTAECEWDGNYTIAHRNGHKMLGDVVVAAANGYRLRKVQLYDKKGHDTVHHIDFYESVDAFIIERKDP